MIDKRIKIKTYDIKVNKHNLKKIIKNYDYIIDGTDSFVSKLSINDECLKQKKSYLLVQWVNLMPISFFLILRKKDLASDVLCPNHQIMYQDAKMMES